MQRVFLPWNQPFLRTAARWSIDRVRSGREVDLSGEEHLLQGRRAMRRYLELLLEECERDRLLLDPPELLLPWSYCALHAESRFRFASDLELEFAWRRSLADAAPDVRSALSLQTRDHGWLAAQLSALQRELAAQGCGAERLRQATELPSDASLRLAALASLIERTDEILRDCELALLEASPLAASSQAGLVLLAVVEMPAMLERRLSADSEATALVHADEADADRFDALGRPLTERWSELDDPIDLRVAENPAQSAARVLERLAELDGVPRDEIVLGLLDPQIEGPLHNELATEGLGLHRAEGVPAERQPLWQALAALAELLRDRSGIALARLVRSSLVDARLSQLGAGDPVALLDLFTRELLVHRVAEPWPPPGISPPVRSILEWIDQLGAELGAPARPIGEWTPALRRCVQILYGDEQLDPAHPAGRRALAMLDALRELLQTLEQWPAGLQLPLEGHAALDLVLQRLKNLHLSELPDPEALESVGWLELASDDSAHVLLLGANEGFLPAAAQPDPFLPDALRALLGLAHEGTRESRDLYLLTRLLRGHGNCGVFVSRRDLSSAPLLPSRLLLRCDDAKLGARMDSLLESPREAATWRVAFANAETDSPSISRPPRLDAVEIPRVSVTDFAAWQNCPYRHHLRRVLGLRARDFTPHELDAAQIGTLVHDLLHRFAREVGELREAKPIEQWLLETLHELAARRFASWAHPSTRLQAELVGGRLRAFARVQAQRREEGWSIVASELPVAMTLDVDGAAIEIYGRIDRLDQHADGRVAIVDVKTSNDPIDPRKAHGPDREGNWLDFQLPLYRRLLLAQRGELRAEQVQTGYLQLPAESTASAFAWARWSEQEHADNFERVREILRAMRRGEGLDAPVEPAPRFSEDVALICRDQVLADEEAEA